MTLYCISEWNMTFELSQYSRSVRGVLIPSRLLGWRRFSWLAKEPRPFETFGVFMFLCLVASQSERRGVLLNTQHHSHDSVTLAHECGFGRSAITRALRVLTQMGLLRVFSIGEKNSFGQLVLPDEVILTWPLAPAKDKAKSSRKRKPLTWFRNSRN